LTLAEVAAALRRLSPSASRVLSLEKKFRDTYASLISLIRDDGLSTEAMQSHPTAASLVSIPDTTTVVFSHAAISEYFSDGTGKFAKRKTAVPVRVCEPEASCYILQTCLQVFVAPESDGWSDSSTALQPYAKSSWFLHIHHLITKQCTSKTATSSKTAPAMSSAQAGIIVSLLYEFLNNEHAVQQWCRDVPWDFYLETKALSISAFVEMWSQSIHEDLPAPISHWASEILETPRIVFLPVAKVNAIGSLQGEWYPLESLSVVAQVRALIRDDDTLDCLPTPGRLPTDVIEKAVQWISMEPNAAWHGSLAICYRRSGHTSVAVEHYEKALAIDPRMIDTRRGLAWAYQELGYYTKVVDLELHNIDILKRRVEKAESQDTVDEDLYQRLSTSYDAIASVYWLQKHKSQALSY